jgi:hypothetical protein
MKCENFAGRSADNKNSLNTSAPSILVGASGSFLTGFPLTHQTISLKHLFKQQLMILK